MNFSMPDYKDMLKPINLIPEIDMRELRNEHLADYQYEVIMDQIKRFEEKLDDSQEVSLLLASFGQSITMAVSAIGYSNPSLMIFKGLVNGNQATLIQHINQISFLMLAVQKENPKEPPRRIGFYEPNK